MRVEDTDAVCLDDVGGTKVLPHYRRGSFQGLWTVFEKRLIGLGWNMIMVCGSATDRPSTRCPLLHRSRKRRASCAVFSSEFLRANIPYQSN